MPVRPTKRNVFVDREAMRPLFGARSNRGPGTSSINVSTASFLTLGTYTFLSNERIFVDGDGLTGTDEGAKGNYTLAMGTPGAVSVASTNAVSASSHTHEATTTSDAASNVSTILQGDASGDLTVREMSVTTYLRHVADADTFVSFIPDGITIEAGGFKFITMVESEYDHMIINDDGADIDFFIEASGVAEAVKVEGSSGYVTINSRLGIGAAPSSALWTTAATQAAARVRFATTVADDTPQLFELAHLSGSPASGDELGFIRFIGYEDEEDSEIVYASIKGITDDVTAGDEAGALEFSVMVGGADTLLMRMYDDAVLIPDDKAMVFGNDADAGIFYDEADDDVLVISCSDIAFDGNVLIADGGVIGQVAGPFLTFDDTNNELNLTGAEFGHDQGNFAAYGDARVREFVVRLEQAAMAQNTWYNLSLDGAGTHMAIPADSVWHVDAHLSGTTQGGGAGMDVYATWTFGVVENDNGTTTFLTIQGASDLHDDRGDMEAQIAVDDATDTVRVQVRTTAADTPTMRFTAHVTATQTIYP